MPLRGPTCKIARFQAGLNFPSWTECGKNSRPRDRNGLAPFSGQVYWANSILVRSSPRMCSISSMTYYPPKHRTALYFADDLWWSLMRCNGCLDRPVTYYIKTWIDGSNWSWHGNHPTTHQLAEAAFYSRLYNHPPPPYEHHSSLIVGLWALICLLFANTAQNVEM